MNNINKQYGRKITLGKGENIKYPDFQIIFLGERKESVPKYARGYFIYYDFEISSGNEKKVVSWSAGTGDIAPLPFDFKGQKYVLEKDTSDIFGPLAADEIIIWRKKQYEKNL